MKRIEERAFEIYPKEYPDPAATFDLMLRGGYVRGATDQQEIDIQRACQWLETSINEDTLHIHQWEHECSKREFIEMFKQAMKG